MGRYIHGAQSHIQGMYRSASTATHGRCDEGEREQKEKTQRARGCPLAYCQAAPAETTVLRYLTAAPVTALRCYDGVMGSDDQLSEGSTLAPCSRLSRCRHSLLSRHTQTDRDPGPTLGVSVAAHCSAQTPNVHFVDCALG